MATRFPSTMPGSDTAALNQLADEINQLAVRTAADKAGATSTLTAAEMVNNVVTQTGAHGALAVTTATAAQLVAALLNPQAGSSFDFVIRNEDSGTITLTGGTGVTLDGTTAVPTLKTQIYKGIVDVATAGSEAVRLIGLLTAAI